MADCWRRSDYDWGRRVSHPNPTWRRDPSPPRRPPGPPRSNTMDSARDPRRKRNHSRSPEGGQSRKQLKPGQPNENASAQTNNSGSRASSTSNGAPRHQSGGVASSPKRRMSVQLSKESSKDTGGLFVNSANASGSLNGNTSGGSTPQQKANGIPPSGKKAASIDGSTDVVMKDSDAAATQDSVLKLLTDFSSQVAAQASLQIARDQAEARVNRLQLEYNANYDKFPEFPAIKERKSADKAAAQKELAAKDHLLSEQKASQQQRMTNLAKMIGQAAEVKPRTDLVSRAEYDRLSTTCATLEQELDTAVSLIHNLRTQLAEVKSSADTASKASHEVASLKDHVVKLDRQIDTLQHFKDISEPTLREAKTLTISLRSAQNAADSTRDQLRSFKSIELTKFATKEALNELEKQYETLDQAVAGVKKTSNGLQRDVGLMKASKFASNVAPSQSTPSPASDVDDKFKEKVEQLAEPLIQKVNDLEKRFDDLEKSLDDLDAFTRSDDGEVKGLSKKFKEAYEQLEQARDSINNMMNDVYEEGEEPLVKRVKNLDQIVNNLSSQIQVIQPEGKSPVQQRLSQLEQDQIAIQDDVKKQPLLQQRLNQLQQDQAAIQKSLKDLQIDAQPQQISGAASGSSVDLKPLNTRLVQVEAELSRQLELAEERDVLIDEHVQKAINAVREELANLDNYRLEDVRSLSASLATFHQSLADLQSSVGGKVSQEHFNVFQGAVQAKVNEMKDEVKTLQQKSRTASQTPTLPQSGPPQYAPAPPQMPNGIMQSPQLPNGVNGSPSLHHAPSPRHGSPHGSGMAQPPLNPAHDLKRMQMQVDQLVCVTQHLKQRCDNLQTDEIVRMMVDQMSHIYPYAKNFDAAISESRNRENALRTDLNKLQSEKVSAVKELNQLICEAKSSSEHAAKTVHEAEKAANLGMTKAANLASTVTRLQANVSKTSSELKSLGEDLRGVSNTAYDADKLSKYNASRLDKLNLEEMKGAFDKLKNAKESVIDRIGTCSAKVDLLEEKVKDLEKDVHS